MSSFRSQSHRANELQACEEIARGLFVAFGYAAELFDEMEEWFDQIAFAVKREIAIAFVFLIRLGDYGDTQIYLFRSFGLRGAPNLALEGTSP